MHSSTKISRESGSSLKGVDDLSEDPTVASSYQSTTPAWSNDGPDSTAAVWTLMIIMHFISGPSRTLYKTQVKNTADKQEDPF